MDNEGQNYKRRTVAEDADEGVVLIAKVPPTDWHCIYDGTHCDATRQLCPFCGSPREKAER